jgi:hypothetical protein
VTDNDVDERMTDALALTLEANIETVDGEATPEKLIMVVAGTTTDLCRLETALVDEFLIEHRETALLPWVERLARISMGLDND